MLQILPTSGETEAMLLRKSEILSVPACMTKMCRSVGQQRNGTMMRTVTLKYEINLPAAPFFFSKIVVGCRRERKRHTL